MCVFKWTGVVFATGDRKAISVESLPDIWLSRLYKGGGYEIKKGELKNSAALSGVEG